MVAAFSGAAGMGIPAKVLKNMAEKGLYVWIDFCCVPQIVRRQDEGTGGSDPGFYDQDAKDLQAAVRSIPAYVERCALFLALVPPLNHCERDQCCDLTGWESRGWCRLEILARWISRDSTQSVIVAESALRNNITVKSVQVRGSGQF